ncbi:unnamed protein product [Rotaria magnacalcarata]|uniref:Uncharacterized protein n=2 Tax=Rotaria magnacalcarata TaxID=392030 RepID=A0A8S3AZQ1_9BILA|nr:unnamed protein product [Rotaria magnacalcarata]
MEEQNIDTYTSPMNLVCYHKQELERQLKQMQIDWNEKVNHMSCYNLKVEQLLQDYITENLHEFRKEIQYEIKIITYDYQIEAIKQEFHRQNPSEYQKKLMEQSCLKRDEKETAEQELKYLQERIDHFNASDQSFEHSAIIDSIENVEIRQQWRKIIEQAKANFCMLSFKIAEDQRSRANLNYDNQVNKMYSIHDNASDFTILPLKMIDLINEHCRMIDERIQSINFFHKIMTEIISKNNETDDFIGIFPATVEFMLWMLHPYDKNGKEIPFQGIRYCTDDDKCQCKRCKKNRMNEWPYERSLSANLLYLTDLHIDDINYTEVIKFEETLVSDYLRHIGEFWKYLTGLCLLAGENGIEILSQFNNGLFDKPIIYHRRLHISCPNIPHPKRNKKIIKYCKQKYKCYMKL